MHQTNATVYLPSGYDSSHSLHLPPSPVSSSSSSSSSTREQDQLNLFRLIEESPNGTEIIGVSKYLHQYISVHLQQFLTTNNIKMDVNNDNFFSNDKFQFNFQLLDIHDPLTNALHLNSLNGQLTIQKRIDRESICSGSKLINNHHINNDIMIDSSHGSSSRLPLNGRPPIFLQNTLNMNKYLNNLGYFTNPMNMISSNLNKKCIKTLNILSTIQILEINEVNVKKIPIDLLIIDINDNNPIWISINNGINDNGNHHHQHNYTTINNDKIPNIIVQISEIPNNIQRIHKVEDHSGVKQQYQQSRISLPRAYDPDEGINSQLTYHLQSINKSIDYRNDHDPKQLNDPNNDIPFILEDIPNGPLELVSTMNLDYELKQYYEFYLLAIDNGQPQRTGTAYIKINIIDVNDHSPIFDQPIFYPPNKVISEKTLPGTIIINLTATDQDVSTMNNRIHYQMIPGTLAMNYFNVQSNGLIILKRWLDYETMETSLTDNQLLLNSLLFNRPTQTTPYALNDNNNNDIDMNIKEKYKKQFIFQVKAVDSAPQPYELTSTALVIIPVMDENDEAPIITVKFLGTTEMTNYGETGVVKENVQPPIQLAYVQVRDLDFNGNDQVNCILTDNVNFSLKPINSLNQFHYQNNEINDPLELQSSLPISQSTLTSKTDYILNLMTKPDREKNPFYFLRIKCIDQASNFNEQTIRLRILDINDEQPKFQKSIYRFNLPENSDKQLKPIGYYRLDQSNDLYITNQTSTIKGIIDERKEYKSDGIEDHYEYRIGRVLAEDNDQGDNARIEYYLDEYFLEIRSSVSSILPSAYLLINKQTRIEDKNLFIYHNENNNNNHNNHGNNEHNHELVRVDQLFRIDSHTGILYALKKFDGENVDMFRFNVFALDQPNQLTSIRHSGTAIVEIKITDVNDWPPLFILTNQTNLNNTDTTNISSSSSKSKQQYFSNVFKGENLTVDDDDHHHHREDELHFVNNYIFHVKENKPAYWLIGRIMAIDLDIESKAMTNKIFNPSKTSFISSSLSYITLRISNDSPLIIRRTFNLHSTNGYLRTSISLDREKQNIYVFNIIAYDGNPSTITSQTSTATVTVIVDDENDNDPVFIRPAISTTTLSSKSESKLDLVNNKLVSDKKENELQPKQYDHLKVNWPASHNDHHNNGDNQLKQTNKGANNNDNNNLIQQTMPFNYNDKSNIPVVLVHRREKSNDFNNGEGEASSLTESRPLLQIEATDADINENAKITYEIGAGNTDNLFVLNSDTGILSLSPNLYSQSDHFIQPLEQNTNLNQNPMNPIAYVLRFEACDHGIPKRCATPIWVQLVIDPNEFPHLVRLPHLTNYLNPSLVTNRNKLNDPSSSVGQTIIGHIEQANMPMLPGHVNSNLNVNNHNNNNNNIGSHQRMNGQENSASSSMESNKRYPPKFTQFKNIWDIKSSLDHQQNDKNVRNQYSSGYQQLSDLKREKHRGIIQPYPYGHDENYITNHNNDGNNQSNSFVISEVAVICLIIVFIILLIAIMVLIYLTRRKTLLLPVPTSKSYLKDGTFRSNPNGCNLKSNQDNNETICAPIELSRNTASFYPVMPDNMISATDITINSNEMSCINDRSIGATEKSITLSTDMLQNPHDSYPLIQGNSEPRLVFNTTLNRPTPQSPLFTSELQNNLNKSTYSPQCVRNPIHSRFDVENEYQCLAPTVDNRISHISRCLTPFFDRRSHQTIQNVEAIGLNQLSNNYRNCLPMGRQQLNSPVSMSHQSIIYTESIMNNEGCEQMSSSKTPTLIYAMSPNPTRHPMHFRGNSLPVYPVNQLQNPTNLKSFQHRLKPQRQEHRNQQHPLSSYQDISLLQATLRRHNHQSIIMNTDPNPMLTYRHPDTNRLICSRDQIHYKTFHTPQHQDDLLISPRIIYTDNLKVCLPNKTKHHHRHHHSPLPLKDEQECRQLLVKNQDDVSKDNDHNCDENVTSGDHEPSNNTDNNNSNNDSVNTTITVDHSEEIPIYVKSSKNSHRKTNISIDNETDYIDNLICNDKPENVTFQSFQYSPTTNSPLPLIIDHNCHHSKEIVKSNNYDSHLISVQRLSKSDASKYTYKTVREASFV
uniref:Cadherin-related n=1 Tax=Schistosoma mansoni TaxID=6183 RepID=A0A3Q0KPJ9_SCHMA